MVNTSRLFKEVGWWRTVAVVLAVLLLIAVVFLILCSKPVQQRYGGCTPYLAGEYYLCKEIK